MPLENYLKCVDDSVRDKVFLLVNYIETNYPLAKLDEYYSEKSKESTKCWINILNRALLQER